MTTFIWSCIYLLLYSICNFDIRQWQVTRRPRSNISEKDTSSELIFCSLQLIGKKTIVTLVMIKYYTVKRKKAKNMSQVSSKLCKVAQSIKYFDCFGTCCEECGGHWTYSYRCSVIINIHRLCHRHHHNYDYHHHYYFMRLT